MKKVAIVANKLLPIPPTRGGSPQNGIWQSVRYFKKYQAFVFSGAKFKMDYPLKEIHFNHHFTKIKRTGLWLDLIKLRYLQFTKSIEVPYIYQIAKKINKIKPEIINLVNLVNVDIPLSLFKKFLNYKPKFIISEHSGDFAQEKDIKKIKYYLDKIDAFIGVSNYCVNGEVLDEFPEYKKKCFTVYNGIDLNKFKPKWQYTKDQIEGLKAKLKIKAEEKIVLFAGILMKDKGVLELIQASIKVFKKYPKWKLLILGSTWYDQNKDDEYTLKLKKLALEMGDRIVFTGVIPYDKINQYYAIADIFCGPSIVQEAFGMVFTEAMASGLPVIASRRGGIPEVVAENETALLIEKPENPLEIAEKLEIMIKDFNKYKQFGINGRIRAEQNFSWELTAKKTEEVYDWVLEH